MAATSTAVAGSAGQAPTPTTVQPASVWQLTPWLILFFALKSASERTGLSVAPLKPSLHMGKFIELVHYIGQIYKNQFSYSDQHPVTGLAAVTATTFILAVGAVLTVLLWVLNEAVRVVAIGFIALLVPISAAVEALIGDLTATNKNPQASSTRRVSAAGGKPE